MNYAAGSTVSIDQNTVMIYDVNSDIEMGFINVAVRFVFIYLTFNQGYFIFDPFINTQLIVDTLVIEDTGTLVMTPIATVNHKVIFKGFTKGIFNKKNKIVKIL